MAPTAYPSVYAALLATLGNALAVRVVDGYDVSNDPRDAVMLGVASLSDTESISAGTFTQEFSVFGRPHKRREAGTINGVAMSWNGDGDAGSARSTAFEYIAAISDALLADPSLGVTEPEDLVVQIASGDVAEDKVDGATCAISFTVAYTAFV